MSPPAYPLSMFMADITWATNVPTAKYGMTRHVKNAQATSVQRRQAGENSSIQRPSLGAVMDAGAVAVGGATLAPSFARTIRAACSDRPLFVSHIGVSGTVALSGNTRKHGMALDTSIQRQDSGPRPSNAKPAKYALA